MGSTEAKWFEKPLSIKQETGLPERISNFLSSLTGEKPTTAKGLLLSLLTVAETSISKEFHENSLKEKEQEIELLKSLNTELSGKLSVSTAETEAVKKETERLQEENKQFTNPETLYAPWFEGLRAHAPQFYHADDKTPLDTLGRILFSNRELDAEKTKLANRLEAVEEELAAAVNKPFEPKGNQVIMEFDKDQLKNIQIVRLMMEKMGHQFLTKDPNEVIHAACSEYIELTRNMVRICSGFQPLIGIL